MRYARTLFSDRVLLNAKTIYFYLDRWVGFEEVVDVIESPAGIAIHATVYWTGDLYPRQATLAQALEGISTRLGIPTPAKPTLGIQSGVAENDASSSITTFYTASFVNSFGEEGDMSIPSDITDFKIGQTLQVGNLGGVSDNTDNLLLFTSVVAYRLYRYDPDSDTSRFVTEQQIDTISFFDNTAETILGESFVTQDFVAPPEDLQGLHLMANGSACRVRRQDGVHLRAEPA